MGADRLNHLSILSKKLKFSIKILVALTEICQAPSGPQNRGALLHCSSSLYDNPPLVDDNGDLLKRIAMDKPMYSWWI